MTEDQFYFYENILFCVIILYGQRKRLALNNHPQIIRAFMILITSKIACTNACVQMRIITFLVECEEENGCQNGGKMAWDPVKPFKCVCPWNYIGERCERQISCKLKIGDENKLQGFLQYTVKNFESTMTGLNNVVLHSLFIVVNSIEQNY